MRIYTAIEVHGVETEEDFMVGKDIFTRGRLFSIASGIPDSHSDIVVLSTALVHSELHSASLRTSVKLVGAFFPTMFPTVDAFALILSSNSFASFCFSSTWVSISFFFATRSSAGCLA